MFMRFLATGCVALVATVGLADPFMVQTAQGQVVVQEPPETVVVFDVAAIDTLDALGVTIAGAVGQLYVSYLDHVQDGAQKMGTLFEPDFEAVYALSPDLIVAGGRSSGQVDALARLAPTIDMTIGNDVLADGLARLRAYGAIFDRSDAAAALEAGVQDKVAQARQVIAGKGNALIIMTNGPKISAYGAGGRFGWLHQDLGLPEAAPQIGESTHGESISFEFISATDPDWLIVIDRLAAIGRPGDSALATLDNVLVRDTKAWSSGKVIYLDPADIYIAGGGLQALNRTLDALIAAFGRT